MCFVAAEDKKSDELRYRINKAIRIKIKDTKQPSL